MGADPRQMAAMMKRLGIEMHELRGVEEVRVVTRDREYVFRSPQVTVTKGQGSEAWQVSGTPKEQARGATSGPSGGSGGSGALGTPLASTAAATGVGGVAGKPPAASGSANGSGIAQSASAAPAPVTKEDIETVMQAARCSEHKAREALAATGGDLAEAILRLTS